MTETNQSTQAQLAANTCLRAGTPAGTWDVALAGALWTASMPPRRHAPSRHRVSPERRPWVRAAPGESFSDRPMIFAGPGGLTLKTA
ncbi:hypothetical protein GCM10012319_54340 [Comamonas sp. KCTC 72670]|nr:hypothetical protein GCM10012319_54340 [Comamonas sp. KCTC 72670]